MELRVGGVSRRMGSCFILPSPNIFDLPFQFANRSEVQ